MSMHVTGGISTGQVRELDVPEDSPLKGTLGAAPQTRRTGAGEEAGVSCGYAEAV